MSQSRMQEQVMFKRGLAITVVLALSAATAAWAQSVDSGATSNPGQTDAKPGAAAVGMKPMVSGMNETQIRKSLHDAGYMSVRSLKRHSDHYNASAKKDGQLVAIRIDAISGAVTEKTR
jgi:hypothetical protein